jgi:hypothetical protein
MTILGPDKTTLSQALENKDATRFMRALAECLRAQAGQDGWTVLENNADHGHPNRLILKLEDTDGDEKPDAASTDLSPYELAIWLEKVEAQGGVTAKIRKMLSTDMHVPDLPEPVYSTVVLKNRVVGVRQRQGAFADGASRHPVVATAGAGPCLIFEIYDPVTHKAFGAHPDAMTDLDQLGVYTDALRALRPEPSDIPLEAHLSGGNGALDFAAAGLERVLSMPGVVLTSAHLDQSPGTGDALALDARTGAITNIVYAGQDLGWSPDDQETERGAMPCRKAPDDPGCKLNIVAQ